MVQGKILVFLALQMVVVTCHKCHQMTTSGRHCHLPFTYKGVLYKSCTSKNHNRPWCSTTANYDKEKKWGNCKGFVSSGVKTTFNEYCVFPFTYLGVVYKSCTSKNHNFPWCSTTANFDKDYKWGNCKGFQSSGVRTTSNEYCVFPFNFLGVMYKSCTTIYHRRPWCSTTADYNKDRMMGNCKGFYSTRQKTISGRYCAFPFIYKRKQYKTCAKSFFSGLWCSTTTNYDKDKKWGKCA